MREAIRRRASIVIVAAAAFVLVPQVAHAQCRKAIVFTLPGITWSDIERWRPPALLETVAESSIGSLSVRTVASRTTLSSGFATIGAGTRLDGAGVSGTTIEPEGDAEGIVVANGASAHFSSNVRVAGLAELQARADEDDYGAVPGALAAALADIPVRAVGNADEGLPPPVPTGFGRWTLLSAMDDTGVVDEAAVGADRLVADPDAPFGTRTDPDAISDAALAATSRCGLTIIDHGDLARADQAALIDPARADEYRRAALFAADDLWAAVSDSVDPEALVLIVSPTHPAFDPDVHFGVAIAGGPRFTAGDLLRSASTHRPGIVTLVDVAPTLLEHFGVSRPSSMQGRPMAAVPAAGEERIAAAIALDEESVFVDDWRTPVATAFVVLQVVVYALAFWWLRRQEIRPLTTGSRARRALEFAALGLIAFPLSTYLIGFAPAHLLGPWGFPLALLAITGVLVVGASLAAARPLGRLLVLTSATTAALVVDLVFGSRLQLNTVFSYSPIVAGRFFGIGNIAFTVLAAAALLTGTLVVHRFKGSRGALIGVAALFFVVTVIDGAPQFGADVGGVLALVPALGLTWLLLAGRRPSWRTLVLGVLGAVALLAVLLAIDLARPIDERTHLARLFEDIRAGGGQILLDALERKIQTNIRVFGSTIWTFLVPPALAFMSYLLLRPQGRWQLLAERHPRLRAGLIGSLLVAVLGFAVNDSGIVVPAVVLSFLAPVAVLIHLSLEQGELA
ncbi:MAG TPA: hypothetical protein VHJ82_07800 [Actinomycetota bacterium]|nr:hypothetical protein [Actinomycetota bacterium]